MRKILITGGSGLIGTRLTEILTENGHQVTHLSRGRKNSKVRTFLWDVPSRKIDSAAFDGVDTIVHLAGANVGDKPWSKARKQEILESRTHSARLLFDTLKNGTHQVRNFISASAIGYYGFDDNERVFHENDEPGKDFLATVVKKWENEVDEISTLGIRVVKVRVGIVLSKDEGALKEMSKPVKFFVGAPLGSGDQKLSWIHIDDVCRVFVMAVEQDTVSGPLNAVGPSPATNREITKAIASTLNRPLILPPIPGTILRWLLGEMSDLALKGSSVSNEKLMNAGFTYKYPTLEGAIRNLLKTK